MVVLLNWYCEVNWSIYEVHLVCGDIPFPYLWALWILIPPHVFLILTNGSKGPPFTCMKHQLMCVFSEPCVSLIRAAAALGVEHSACSEYLTLQCALFPFLFPLSSLWDLIFICSSRRPTFLPPWTGFKNADGAALVLCLSWYLKWHHLFSQRDCVLVGIARACKCLGCSWDMNELKGDDTSCCSAWKLTASAER